MSDTHLRPRLSPSWFGFDFCLNSECAHECVQVSRAGSCLGFTLHKGRSCNAFITHFIPAYLAFFSNSPVLCTVCSSHTQAPQLGWPIATSSGCAVWPVPDLPAHLLLGSTLLSFRPGLCSKDLLCRAVLIPEELLTHRISLCETMFIKWLKS